MDIFDNKVTNFEVAVRFDDIVKIRAETAQCQVVKFGVVDRNKQFLEVRKACIIEMKIPFPMKSLNDMWKKVGALWNFCTELNLGQSLSQLPHASHNSSPSCQDQSQA